MRKRFWVQSAITALLCLIPATKMLADLVTAPAAVTEALWPPQPVDTQYNVFNNSSASTAGGPFDITLFLATTTGSDPTTTNADWTAETVDAATWDQPMDQAVPIVTPADGLGEENSLTWQQYTGLTYTQAFPSSPVKLNGYFLNYSVDSLNGKIFFPPTPIIPNTSLGGFFYTGAEGSTFLVGGPTDGTTSFLPGDVVTYSGTTTDLPSGGSSAPLPSGLALGLVALAISGLAIRRVLRWPAHPGATA